MIRELFHYDNFRNGDCKKNSMFKASHYNIETEGIMGFKQYKSPQFAILPSII